MEHTWTVTADTVFHADNMDVLGHLPSESFQLIYIDPPFNTGKVQKRQSLKTVAAEDGGRIGFKGQSYKEVRGRIYSYNDSFADYWEFLYPRLQEAWRLLNPPAPCIFT